MDIELLLSPLIGDMINNKFSTKQKAFEQHINSIDKSIDLFGWNKTINHINEMMGSNLSINTYKTMVYRIKKKNTAEAKANSNKNIVNSAIQKTKDGIVKNPLSKLSGTSKSQLTEYNPTPDKSRIYGDDNE